MRVLVACEYSGRVREAFRARGHDAWSCDLLPAEDDSPRHIIGDAAGEISVPPDGRWNDTLREAYADRIEAILCRHIPGFKSLVLARRCYSPADLEAMNVNLVGGDPYGGACSIDQFFLWRPFRSTKNHETPVKRLWQIGASTHPGPGLGGGSGFLLASNLK